MKKAGIYVFSGTGNTRFAAEKIANALSKYGFTTTIWEVRAPFFNVLEPQQYDLVGFGYPIHAFNTPRFFLRFVKTLPPVHRIPAFIFKTSGEPFHVNSASSWPLVRILRKKGFLPMMDRHLLMPYNIMFRYRDALAKQMALHTTEMAGVIAASAAKGQMSPLHYYPWTILWMYLFRLQWFGAWINGPLIHAKKNRCIGCGKCVAACPAKNIRMENGVPRFSHHCTMCMGCVLFCPMDAIRPGILNPWRVNGPYHLQRLMEDPAVSDEYINEETKGYFKLFRPYYKRTYEEIAKYHEQEEAQAMDKPDKEKTAEIKQ